MQIYSQEGQVLVYPAELESVWREIKPCGRYQGSSLSNNKCYISDFCSGGHLLPECCLDWCWSDEASRYQGIVGWGPPSSYQSSVFTPLFSKYALLWRQLSYEWLLFANVSRYASTFCSISLYIVEIGRDAWRALVLKSFLDCSIRRSSSVIISRCK